LLVYNLCRFGTPQWEKGRGDGRGEVGKGEVGGGKRKGRENKIENELRENTLKKRSKERRTKKDKETTLFLNTKFERHLL